MIDKTILEQKFYSGQVRTFVDASLNPDTNIGKIGIVVYTHESLLCTHIIPDIPSKNINLLEFQGVKISDVLYPMARIHTDSQYPFLRAGKIRNRLYLIDGKYNPADRLLRGNKVSNTLDLHELVTNWCLSNHDSVNPMTAANDPDEQNDPKFN